MIKPQALSILFKRRIKMKTAEELLDIVTANSSKLEEEYREQVRQQLDEFIENWATETGLYRAFTEEEMNERFTNAYIAKNILEKQGFCVRIFPEEKTGHLWWKKVHPAKWVIRIPIKKQETDC